MELLDRFKREHPDLRALLLIYRGPSPQGKVFKRLQEEDEKRTWFNVLILQDNDKLLAKEISSLLALGCF
jgi:hypothetical protein